MSRNWQGAHRAIRYLLDLGHRRIGFIGGDPELASAEERMAGYCDALAEAGIAFDSALVAAGNFRYSGGLQAAQKLLDLAERPTAIVAANDFSAIGAIEAIRGQGLSIPEDISIIGFDDIPQAKWLRPALTTVRQPLVEMGHRATQLLLRMLASDEDAPALVEHVLLDTELIIRESCQPPGVAATHTHRHGT
jgi:LacI family transcriptional regulator